MKYFEDALRISQYERFVALGYGEMLMNQKKFRRAKEIFEAYLKINPDDNEIKSLLENTEIILAKVGRFNEAIDKIVQ